MYLSEKGVEIKKQQHVFAIKGAFFLFGILMMTLGCSLPMSISFTDAFI